MSHYFLHWSSCKRASHSISYRFPTTLIHFTNFIYVYICIYIYMYIYIERERGRGREGGQAREGKRALLE